MNSLETNTHAFVIRVWLEETREDGQVIWRGHITHVLSGKRSYFNNLKDILAFIIPYLEEMGVKVGKPPFNA